LHGECALLAVGEHKPIRMYYSWAPWVLGGVLAWQGQHCTPSVFT
jgi:hypothetical protein